MRGEKGGGHCRIEVVSLGLKSVARSVAVR